MKIGYAGISTKEHSLSMPIDALKKANCDQIHEEMARTRENIMKQISNMVLLASLLFMSSIQADNALFSFKRIGQVAPSPNGEQVAIVTYEFKNTALGKEWFYSLYLKDQSGLKVLANAKRITSISWSPDGEQIAYLSEGKKSQSIWSYQLNHHKKEILFEFTSDILV